MPEIVEVTKAARAFRKALVGTKLTHLIFHHPKMELLPSPRVGPWLAENQPTITQVRNHSKYLIFECDKCVVLSHFKFTGWWVPSWQKDIGVDYFVEGNPADRLDTITRMTLQTDRGPLHWVDQRLLGFVSFYSWDSFKTKSLHLRLGPPINSDEFTLDLFVKRAKMSRKQIGEFLLDQDKFSGIGNWMRAEILYSARQHPEQIANTLSEDRLGWIWQSIRAIYNMGMTHDHYEWWNVFQRKTDHKGNPVVRLPRGARGLYYCPAVQVMWS